MLTSAIHLSTPSQQEHLVVFVTSRPDPREEQGSEVFSAQARSTIEVSSWLSTHQTQLSTSGSPQKAAMSTTLGPSSVNSTLKVSPKLIQRAVKHPVNHAFAANTINANHLSGAFKQKDDLISDLQNTNIDLQNTNIDLQSTNIDLQNTNMELFRQVQLVQATQNQGLLDSYSADRRVGVLSGQQAVEFKSLQQHYDLSIAEMKLLKDQIDDAQASMLHQEECTRRVEEELAVRTEEYRRRICELDDEYQLEIKYGSEVYQINTILNSELEIMQEKTRHLEIELETLKEKARSGEASKHPASPSQSLVSKRLKTLSTDSSDDNDGEAFYQSEPRPKSHGVRRPTAAS